MSLNTVGRFSLWLPVIVAVLLPQPALAYIGPGVGLGAVAVAFALVFGFGLLIVGLVWFPLKRALKRKRKTRTDGSQDVQAE